MKSNLATIHQNFDQVEELEEILNAWTNPNHLNIAFLTSGSTGNPKRIEIPKKALIDSVKRTASALNWKDEKCFVALPIDKTGGKMMVIRALQLDQPFSMVKPGIDPFKSLPLKHTFTTTSLTPLQLNHVLNSNDETTKLQQFKSILVGGGELSNALIKRLHSVLFQDQLVFHTYGMTETASHVALKQIHPKFEENLRMLEGIKWGTQSDGAFWCELPHIGRVNTNDIIEKKSDQEFVVLGRRDFIINSGGVKHQPELLETKVQKVFEEAGLNRTIMVSAVVDPVLGYALVLCVEGLPITDKSFLETLLIRSLRRHEMPKHWCFLNALPRLSNGKLDRQQMKAELKVKFS